MTRRRPRQDSDPELTDKERILLAIISRLHSSMSLGGANMRCRDDTSLRLVYFDQSMSTESLKKGDLVFCTSSGIHRFTVGYVDQVLGYSEVMIRELDSDKVCRVGNEGFSKIVNLDPSYLRVGHERVMSTKIWKALCELRNDHFPAIYRGDVEFLPGRVCRISIGLHIWFAVPSGKEDAEFTVDVPWTPRISLKAIRKAVVDAGLLDWLQDQKKKPETT